MIDGLSSGALKYQALRTDFYEGSSPVHGKILIQKVKEGYNGIHDLVSIKNDFEISQSHQISSILGTYDLVEMENSILLVKEYFDGLTFTEFIGSSPSIEVALKASIELAKSLQEIHNEGVVVKNLCPKNILIHRDTFEIKISSIGLASEIKSERVTFTPLESYEGSLYYISPEQTGRVGRSIDYRSDYYALGIILYELLTGTVPFNYQSKLELIHAHIAKKPFPPSEINARLPKQLSELILKLLSKNAEDRYQSLEGLLSDLKQCLDQWQAKKAISPFTLGKKDHSKKFIISEKLYGRNKELKELKSAFERISEGPLEIFYVFGYSGIGKTRLIEELQSQVSVKHGFVTSGKFDQYHKETPYYAFSQAFNSLVYQLLSEEEHFLNKWKIDFIRALDGNGQVLLEIVPDLELLLGKQSDVFNLGYTENKSRFLNAVKSFLSVLDGEDRPIMFFIDDLQWADRSSLELINHLLDSKLNNILLIGSYRDNEVDESHPLSHHIAEQKQKHPDRISEINLKELDLFEVNQLISDSLGLKSVETIDLSELLVNKTQGNPFFIKQFINKLVDEDYIHFDLQKYGWTWDLNKISDLDVTDNMVDMVINSIQKLSKESQKIISLASCVGNIFDLGSLSIISQVDEKNLSDALWEAVKNTLIHPIGSWTRYYSDNLWKSLGVKTKKQEEFKFRFQHDKIQQAAYSLIPEKQKSKTHKEIGLLLYDRLGEVGIDEDIFDILDHLNFGFGEEVPDDWVQKLAKLNLKAGIKAKSSSAIESSEVYLKKCMELLADKPTSELYKNALIHRSECAFLAGEYDLSESLFDSAIDKMDDILDKAEILGRKMAVYENTQRHELAIEAARSGLKLLGIELPEEETQEMVFAEFGAAQQLLEGKSTRDLLDNKNMSDPRIALSMKLLMNMWGPVYLLSRQNLLAFMILRMIQLSIKHGNSIESALAYSFYGYLISAQMHLYDLGYEYATLGIDLNAKLDDKVLRSKVLVISEGCVAHWKVPFKKLLPNLQQAWEFGIETNDTIYAGYATSFMNRASVLKGTDLQESYENLSRFLKFCMKINSEISKHQILCWQRLVIKLSNKEADPYLFGNLNTEEEHFHYVQKLNSEQGLMLPMANYQVANAIYDYIMNKYDEGLKRLEEVGPIMPAVLGLPEYGYHNVMYVLNLLGSAKKHRNLLTEKAEIFNEQLDLLSKRAAACPSNYGQPFFLAQGERLFIDNNYVEAKAKYNQALDLAQTHDVKHFSALAHERLAELYFKETDLKNGFLHLKSAYFFYKRWGADAKASLILNQVEEIAGVVSHSSRSSASTFSSDSLDLQAIFDTATAISSEVIFGDLLNKLLEILIKNAGAQNAYLFLIKKKEVFLEASMKMSNNFESEISSTRLSETTGLPKSLIRLVYNSGDTFIINDAKNDPQIAREKELDIEKFESILCIPIKYHNKITGIIYLENTLMKNAFLPERVELLQLFSGQIAISIENAQLYATLEQKVEDRTRTIENQKLALVKEKHKVDNLLLNILPSEVAEVLKHEGYYMPQKHEIVTILFTDFEDFTTVSQRISPEQLVAMIDKCYIAYDEICEKYNIEKIKTIGDSYMCVSGLTGSKSDHAVRMVQAAKEMMEFTMEFNKERAAFGLPYCDLRIGIHSGPVVAGVVGKKKFAFDIWGDSVNTASRMQSYGEALKINVSDDTWTLLQGQFKGIDRGDVVVKNKGKIKMYFII